MTATAAKQGILLVNLGTPATADAQGVRDFLEPFLGDKRVVSLPRFIWYPILYGIILRKRPERVAKLYQKIWTDAGSPLMAYSVAQQQQLQAHLGDDYLVELGMTYGQPAIDGALARLLDAGCEKIRVIPLYPQYSTTTTGPIEDQVVAFERGDEALISIVSDYHRHPLYIDALASSVEEFRADQDPHDSEQPRLLLSFHGLPQRLTREGDPYEAQCQVTAQLLARKLQLNADQWVISFQSRFGAEPWLQPYTDKLLEEWAATGRDAVQVYCPGFAADCLETLEEIAIQNREGFIDAGGKRYQYIPALNTRRDHIQLLAALAVEDSVSLVENAGRSVSAS